MVGKLTYGKRQWESLDGDMRRLIPVMDAAFRKVTAYVDADTHAFNDYMLALKMPKVTEAEVAARAAAMDEGLKKAVEVPYRLAKAVNATWEAMLELAGKGNVNCKSDMQVGCLLIAFSLANNEHQFVW